ncbi:hypothetical protein ACOMHN_009635 [Nucella lapillus]
MEKEAAVRMWSRSIRKNGMRYVRMLSDGDSVAYKAVKDANLYQVDKLECLNHCDKRMADLQGYQARQNLKRFAQADVDLEPATKRSRKEHKRAAKTSKRGQERQEGQTYGSGMV